MEELTGHIERITFQNAENGWTVARVDVPGKTDLVTVVGNLASVQIGETVRCQGFWKKDINYGYQFEVKSYEVEQPATVYGIKKYLGSGMIKGIGNVYAERIVNNYGARTLDIIDENPNLLMDIEGIGPKRIERIKACWEEQKAIRKVMVFLQSQGVSPTFAQKIFKTYGETSLDVINANPYQLARDIWGIGFKTADQIARKLGMDVQAPQRIDSGAEYVLSELANEGHTCYPVDKFLEAAHALLEVEANLIAQRLEHIVKDDRALIERLDTTDGPLACIWLKPFYISEQGIGKELQRIRAATPKLRRVDVDRAVDWAEQKLELQLASNQRAAVRQSLQEKVQLITGGPGTGKSTITKVILLILHQLTDNILLAAPTGRAAKRMQEITGTKASTIHSLLKYDFSIGDFQRNRDHPLDCDLLIVDEASMIDTVLMYSLLKAVPNGAKLILVGDVDQLPSVGPGNVMLDLIQSEQLPTTRLTEIFRQAKNSAIILNAHRINAGILPDLKVRKGADFFFMSEEDPERIAVTITDLVERRLPSAYGFDSFEDIQVLTPMNRGQLGTRNLNNVLQAKLNPSYEPLFKAGRRFHVSDKVMQIRNNYDLNVFNGDVGVVDRIDVTEQEMRVNYQGEVITYDFADLDQLVLAYAVSVHKYQGSECPCVVIPIHTSHYSMLFRNLLYTGITRGKRLVVLIGTKKALAMCVRNNKVAQRYTGLRQVFKG